MDFKERLNEKLDQGFKKEQKSWLGFFIKNYRFTYLIIIALIVFGLIAMLTLPREAQPEVKVPYAAVTTLYVGASPNDVESNVTNKLENEIKNLENLDSFESQSSLGLSSVIVKFEAEADLKDSLDKLKEAVDRAKPKLPKESEDPIVTEIRMNDFPIVTYSLIGDYSDEELKYYADKLKEKLESIKDVSKVEIIGGLEKEFQVIVNQKKLTAFNLSLNQAINAINSNNFNLPAGTIEIDDFRYNVRIKGKINKASDLNNIVIATYEDSPVFLKDIAEIKDTFKEKNTESHIGYPGESSKNAISLQIYKSTGGNILNIVENSEKTIKELQGEYFLPNNLKIEKTNDNSVYIKDDIRILGSSAIQTFILITLILLAILSLRGAIITALAVPIAFLMSFMFLDLQDMTLNSMVLFSLVLSLGLMVDNAIVIMEGINEYVEKHGKTVYQGAILSIWNFKSAITSGTLTTVAAFLPLLLVSGIMGEYISIIPKTLVVTLLSSLFVALVIIPTLVTRFIKVKNKPNRKNRDKKRHVFVEKIMNKLISKYQSFLVKTLENKKKRVRIILTGIVLFVLSISTIATGLVKIEMFPKIDFDYFYINIELPNGSNIEQTKKITKNIEEKIKDLPELDNYVTNIGSQMSGFDVFSSNGSSQNKANLTINLINGKRRERSSIEIAESLRKELKDTQGAIITIEELQAGPPSGAPVEIRLFSNNSLELAKSTKIIENYLENKDGIINIDSNLVNSTGEFVFSINKQKANYYNLNVNSIASTVRTALYGTTASSANIEDDEIDIVVKYAKESFNDINSLTELLITTPSGQKIPLKEVAELKIEPSLLSINHKDGKRIVSITASIESDQNIQEITQTFLKEKNSIGISEDVLMEIGGETEDVEKSFTEMFYSMIIAIFLIGTILILQFNSFRQPFIILFALPLSIVGVIIGLLLLNMSFSISVFIGIVSLSGIVVNDAIVLIDKINKNIKNGLSLKEAIINGGSARMQPILITSITTIVGIAPLIFSSELWRGLSISIIFGLLFSTLLNLIFVPILYSFLCKKKF
ncbi:efflux RND transporter permease subunit [bacterium]|nr:efflux RND transporter permease subunit [bacterium]